MDVDVDDAYEDLEDWYSTSFPHVTSAPSMDVSFAASASSEGGETTSHDCVEVVEVDEEEVADDYEIVLEPHDDASVIEESETHVLVDATALETSVPLGTLDDVDDITVYVPKKFASRRAVGPSPSAVRCCDRCYSDLNGKLLVRCSRCAFCRHLYCFSPPLKQHPALLTPEAALPRHQRPALTTLVARWACEQCPAPVSSSMRKTQQTKRVRPKKTKSPKLVADPVEAVKTQPLPVDGVFDWHAFRAAKFDRVIAENAAREEDEVEGRREELVLFPPSLLLMKRTARFWKQYVREKKRWRQANETKLFKCRLPAKRNVMMPPEAKPRRESQQNEQEEDEEERMLFDDSRFYPLDDERPVFQTLRRRRAVVALPEQQEAVALHEKELAAWSMLWHQREQEETVRMAEEDDDALTPAQAQRLKRRRAAAAAGLALAGVDSEDPSVLGLHLAAWIIQQCVTRWIMRARRRIEQQSIDEQHKRDQHARFQVGVLRQCVLFLVIMIRHLRHAQIKKVLVLKMQDAVEDRQVATTTVLTASARETQRRDLATKRIQRFFCRDVRRYIRLKEQVMARRLVRWWKHKYFPWKWRTAAIEARRRHRDAASRRIQRRYRQFRVYKAFRTLLEKHALRQIRLFLRGWLMRRLANRERERMAIHRAALKLGLPSATTDLLLHPDASVHNILLVVGMALYETSDFWHAAGVLERWQQKWKDVGTQDDGDAAEARVALAYSHHMAWYNSCDAFHLTQAHALYQSVLQNVRSEALTDSFALQELALMLMHLDEPRASLRVLARLIELFPQDDGFPLWLFLAGVQLQQVGEWAQSVEYLTYLSDLIPPSSYHERDVLALCAISYEHIPEVPKRLAQDAWKAAIRLWTLEKKQQAVTWGGYHRHPMQNKQESVSAKRKWELLRDLAERASAQGHYLVSCRALLYALDRVASSPSSEEGVAEQQRAWWHLGDAFRHLGRLDLYVEAAARSRNDSVSDAERTQWKAHAEAQATRFESKFLGVSILKMMERIAYQYSQQVETNEGDLHLEEIGDIGGSG
ncbi:hypothetical protein Poli38472_002880 [Pythium oligandrum]|uniref:Uncharacterized protein n=1 Tax=Pythium oligandrum TaxID=41045 RepID=A0A8K1FB69_PYTOL|nr:hypothetical protein Poli38472_002880 [Pythium oligandrum]|eukprot:TMW56955.1 hypothetical protein Poli38472_002880 [Pythium oligandrum]